MGLFTWSPPCGWKLLWGLWSHKGSFSANQSLTCCLDASPAPLGSPSSFPLSLSLVCVMHIHSLAHIYTLNAPCSVIVGIFHSAAAGEHCSQLCCQLQYMLKSQRLFADILILPTSFFCLPSCVWIQARTQLWGQKSTWRASVLMSISSKTLTYKLRIARITKKNFMQRSMCAF